MFMHIAPEAKNDSANIIYYVSCDTIATALLLKDLHVNQVMLFLIIFSWICFVRDKLRS